MLIILNKIANRSKIIATGIDGAAVTLVSAQHTNYLTIIIIHKYSEKSMLFKYNFTKMYLCKSHFFEDGTIWGPEQLTRILYAKRFFT